MTKVVVDLGVSLDGFVAGGNRGPSNPLGDGFEAVHAWMFDQNGFLRDGAGGELIQAMFARTGANVMGRNMFDEGEANWPENAPFHCPVFVLTHRPREPWVRPGGTTFHFVTDGFDSALGQARAAAGGKDVRVSGGADVARQALKASIVDELNLHIAPVVIGAGLRLFDGVPPGELDLVQTSLTDARGVAHVTYKTR